MPATAMNEMELEPGGSSLGFGSTQTTNSNPTMSQYSIVSNKSCSAIKHTGRSHSDIVPLGTSTRSMVLLQAEALHSIQESSNPEEDEWKYKDPPDTWHSWWMLLCCCLIQIAYGAIASTSGIFFVEFLDIFGKGRELTSWVSTLQQSLMFIFGPFAGLMVDKFGHRITLIIGCVGTGLSIAAAIFTSSFEVMFITYGISAGVFCSCIAIPSTVCSADYFQRHRVLALTITGSCFPITQLIFPPLITTLLEHFGWRPAMLAVATVFLQSTVLAVLLRPQRLKKLSTPLSGDDSAWYTSTTSGFGKLRKDPSSHYTESHYSLYGEDTSKPSMYLLEQDSLADKFHESHAVLRSEYTLQMIPEHLPLQINTDTEKINTCIASKPDQKRRFRTNQLLHICFKDERCKSFCQSTFWHWRLLVLIAYNLMWGFGSSVFYVLLPDLANSRSFTPSQIAQLLMLSGAVGLAGRLATVGFCKLGKNFSKAMAVFISMMVQLGGLVGASLAESFVGFTMMTGVFSFGYGASSTLSTPLIIEMHGEERLAVVFGMQMLLYGMGFTVSAPFAAWLYQQTNSYSAGFQCAAAVNFTGCLLLLPHIIQRYRNNGFGANS